MEIKIVCPSRKRADHLLTKNVIENLIVIVRQEEVEEYRRKNPDVEIIGTPEWVDNIAKTRQWMFDTFDQVFMVDDDVTGVHRTYIEKGETSKITDKQTVFEIIRECAYITKEIGAYVFGFQSIRNPNEYISHRPFRHTGYLNNSHIGFIKGHNLVYSQEFGEAEDYYISCLNYYKHRYAFIDTRFTFHTKDNFLAQGGVNDLRTTEMMVENTLKLRKLFGEVVKIKKPTNNKSKVHLGERSLVFPY